jgi:hypothetical protein
MKDVIRINIILIHKCVFHVFVLAAVLMQISHDANC